MSTVLLGWQMAQKVLIRDGFARMVLVLPLIIAVVLQNAIQLLAPMLASQGILLADWYGHLFAFFLGLNIPLLYGVVVGFLILEEIDQRTILALKVTPTPLVHVLWQRTLLAAVLTSTSVAFLAVALGWFAPSAYVRLIIAALFSGGYAGVVVMVLATYASSKLAGFALIKVAGIIVILPIAALVSHHPWSGIAAIIPTYWLAHIYVDATTLPRDIVVNLVLLCGCFGWLSWRFQRIQHGVS